MGKRTAKAILVAGVLSGVVGAMGTADAAVTILRSNSASPGDCSVYTNLKTNGGTIQTTGVFACTKAHSKISTTHQFKINGSVYQVGGAYGGYDPSMKSIGDTLVYQLRVGECVSAQSVYTWSFSGVGTSYMTTGAPVRICGQ
jgi:hypothetical protein